MPSTGATKLAQQAKRREAAAKAQEELIPLEERLALEESKKVYAARRQQSEKDRKFIAYRKKKIMGPTTPSPGPKGKPYPMTPQQEAVQKQTESNESARKADLKLLTTHVASAKADRKQEAASNRESAKKELELLDKVLAHHEEGRQKNAENIRIAMTPDKSAAAAQTQYG